MAEGQITTASPELEDRFAKYLQEQGVTTSPESEQVQEEVSEATDAAPKAESSQEEPPVETESNKESEAEESDQDVSAESTDTDSEEVSEPNEEDSVETLSDLAKAFEVDEQEFVDHLQIPSRDGDGTVSLSEVIDSYKSAPTENEESRVYYENLGKSLQGEHDARLVQLQKLTATMVAQIDSEPDVDWDMLRDTDPAQYLKEREGREARRSDVERSLKAMDEEMARRDSDASGKHEEWRGEQIETLYRLRPDWKDPDKGRQAMSEVQDYLVKTGYPKEQIDSLEDARSILTVWRAAQWEQLQAKRPEVKKRLRLLPRTLRSSARADAAATSDQQVEAKKQVQLRDRLSETGSVSDAAALMRGLL